MKGLKGRSRRAFIVLALLLAALPARAHVGSPNVFYDGSAGPYPLRVIVRTPVVIPGIAEVTVKLRGGTASAVTAQPIPWETGTKGAPPPDVATPVPGAPGVWSAQIWIMQGSSYGVRVRVKGAAGGGETLVPVTAVPTQVLEMKPGMGIVLGALGLFLFAGAVTLVVSGVREASLPPGEVADGRRRNRARIVGAEAAVVLALLLWGGKSWWDSANAQAKQGLYKPFHVTSATRLEGGRPVLSLAIDDERRPDWSPLMPDHGKLMHLFLVREPGFDAFAHVHPVPAGTGRFEVSLPPLPAGTYRLYADVVHESGFPQTLVDRVTVPATSTGGTGGPAPDPDDSWRNSAPLAAKATSGPQVSPLEGGGTLVWQAEPLKANREAALRFEARDAAGNPLALEPYMGMLSHAVITRYDGQVFVHLHPMGTINMAAQERFEKETGMGMMEMAGMDYSAPGAVTFPYEFPQPGRYRLWVQVKSGGQVRTGVFDAVVAGR